jgi:hypothetical protein
LSIARRLVRQIDPYFAARQGFGMLGRPSKTCGNTSRLPAKPIRGTMVLKLAAIWECPGEPIMPRVTYFHEITLEDVPEGRTLLEPASAG